MTLLAALVRKILREQRWTLALCCLFIGLFFTLGTYLYTTFGQLSMEAISRFSPELLQGMFGGLLGGIDPLETWLVTLFVHPLVLTLYSVVAVAVTSRSLAGEIDGGTIDILLSCPIPRWKLVAATTIVTMGAHVAMTLVVWLSLRLGMMIGDIEPPESLSELRWVAVNLFALFTAVGGVSLLVSATSSERGRAVGRALAFIVLSYFVNIIASLWDEVARLEVVSVFHYHQPQPVVAAEGVLFGHLAVLYALFAVCFAVALLAFQRRDIATV